MTTAVGGLGGKVQGAGVVIGPLGTKLNRALIAQAECHDVCQSLIAEYVSATKLAREKEAAIWTAIANAAQAPTPPASTGPTGG
jgi:hypothetical protein